MLTVIVCAKKGRSHNTFAIDLYAIQAKTIIFWEIQHVYSLRYPF